MILSVALCEMCQCYSTDSIIPLIPGQWQADWLMSSLGPLGPGPVAAEGWERLKGWWRGGGGGGGGGELRRRPRESRVRGRVRRWSLYRNLWQETDCRWPLPTPRRPPILTRSGGGGTNKSGGLYDQTEDKKSEREWGKACVFPRHASSCETMIYAFLRTPGSQNVTFNQAHREGSKC